MAASRPSLPHRGGGGHADLGGRGKLENVVVGLGIAVLPLSTAQFSIRPDVVHVPVTDISQNRVVAAWLSERREPLLAEFAALA